MKLSKFMFWRSSAPVPAETKKMMPESIHWAKALERGEEITFLVPNPFAGQLVMSGISRLCDEEVVARVQILETHQRIPIRFQNGDLVNGRRAFKVFYEEKEKPEGCPFEENCCKRYGTATCTWQLWETFPNVHRLYLQAETAVRLSVPNTLDRKHRIMRAGMDMQRARARSDNEMVERLKSEHPDLFGIEFEFALDAAPSAA